MSRRQSATVYVPTAADIVRVAREAEGRHAEMVLAHLKAREREGYDGAAKHPHPGNLDRFIERALRDAYPGVIA